MRVSRTKYQAAIMAVHRHGQRIRDKIGSIELQAGDTLLMVTKKEFLTQHRHQDHFALVSQVDGHSTVRKEKAPFAVLFALVMIVLSVAEVIDLLAAAFCAAGAMIMTRCMTTQEVRTCHMHAFRLCL